MKNSNISPTTKLISGVDHISLDQRRFNPSGNDIKLLCDFFSIGKLKCYEQEKNIITSHSNFFIYVETTQGQYAIKFYPINDTKSILNEYKLNRFLTDIQFPTPSMLHGLNKQPFITNNNRLATCFSYIHGETLWRKINKTAAVVQVNNALLSLKEILKKPRTPINFYKQKSLITIAKELKNTFQSMRSHKQSKLVTDSLKEVLLKYQNNKKLFTRQKIHNNANLTNFLIARNSTYMLDLSHVCEDYSLSDLASMIISCFFFNIPRKNIQSIIQNYFEQHNFKNAQKKTILETLIKIKLIAELLKNIHRENSADSSSNFPKITDLYRSLLSDRINLISALLQPKAFHKLL